MSTQNIRNLAIIAHVDHGKTTMIDNMLKQSGMFRDNEYIDERMMDSNELEKERGITIRSKCTGMKWKDVKINIVDTPGHSDFGGEVERILSMVDGVILLVDASEGPMPQTKFVLSKALKLNLKPIVVINKSDRSDARISEVLDEILELFIDLEANDEQLDFPVMYASGRNGWAVSDLEKDKRENLHQLFDLIINYIKPPIDNNHLPFSMIVTTREYDSYLGRIIIGRIFSGNIAKNMTIKVMNHENHLIEQGKITKISLFYGIQRIETDQAECGDIVTIAGLSSANVSDTVCSLEVTQPLKAEVIDPPTLSMVFSVNNSPLANENKKNKVTSRVITERLLREAEGNVTILVEKAENESLTVSGRGELQFSILIETMRREGYELSISRPKVIMKKNEETGQLMEPYEEVQIDIDSCFVGVVMDSINKRNAKIIDTQTSHNDKVRLKCHAPSRTLIGYHGQFMTETRGTGIMNRSFYAYQLCSDKNSGLRHNGVLISNSDGVATAYALSKIEDRGILFIEPGTKVYVGMIIGEHNRESDLEVNVIKGKQLTNIRSVLKDEAIKLSTPRIISMEWALSYIRDDERVEVTPDNIRLHKTYLCPNQRKRMSKN